MKDALIVTLDGPAGSGKSTVAQRVAERLGLEFLDTGAMYRGLTAACLDWGIDPAADPDEVIDLARRAQILFDWAADPHRLLLRVSGVSGASGVDHDVTDRLRDPDVTYSVSDVAAMGEVREILVRQQQRIGREHPRLVTEGRDQGSVVFPDARVKFFLEATPQVRAQRRADQLRLAGKPADVEEILEQITQRDQRDSHRKDGPLICPPGALRIDTSAMTLDAVVDLVESEVRQRVGGAGDGCEFPAGIQVGTEMIRLEIPIKPEMRVPRAAGVFGGDPCGKLTTALVGCFAPWGCASGQWHPPMNGGGRGADVR